MAAGDSSGESAHSGTKTVAGRLPVMRKAHPDPRLAARVRNPHDQNHVPTSNVQKTHLRSRPGTPVRHPHIRGSDRSPRGSAGGNGCRCSDRAGSCGARGKVDVTPAARRARRRSLAYIYMRIASTSGRLCILGHLTPGRGSRASRLGPPSRYLHRAGGGMFRNRSTAASSRPVRRRATSARRRADRRPPARRRRSTVRPVTRLENPHVHRTFEKELS